MMRLPETPKPADQMRREGWVVECPECGNWMYPYEDPFTKDKTDIWWCCRNVNCGHEMDDRDVE